MRSMTGYGRGECAQDGFKVSVELSAVNRRQGEVTVNLPREMDALESRVRDRVNQQVSRGRVTVRVSLDLADEAWATRARLNRPLARAYARALAQLAKELKLEGGVTLETLVRAPGVLQTEETGGDPDRYASALDQAVEQALTGLVRMRDREGAHLAKDLKGRVAVLRQATRRIEKLAPAVLVRYREQLRERVHAAGLETPLPDDERLAKELVYFADRSDITEEITRLQSHFQQFDASLKSAEPVGRTLDFLAQEMNREVNTLGSKANDSGISREVVRLKAELEKFREQVQNVE